MSDLSSQITALEDQLVNLRRRKMIEDQAQRELTDSQKLAIVMHDALCTHNHTDGCGWHYEIKDGVITTWGPNSTHGHWHEKARRMTGFCCQNKLEVGTAIGLFKFLKEA